MAHNKLSSMQQMIKSPAAISDDHALVHQILTKHAPDGREIDSKALLRIVEDILRNASLNTEDYAQRDTLAQNHSLAVADQNNLLSYMSVICSVIKQISNEISYNAYGDAHTTTVAVFDIIKEYEWDAKLVLTLAAVALNSGEFWLLVQGHDQLTESMAALRGLQNIRESAGQFKHRFDVLNDLLKVILEVTKCVIQLKRDIPQEYMTPQVSESESSYIPFAAYWCVRSIVVCANQIQRLFTMSNVAMQSPTDTWELSSLNHKLKNIADHFRKQLDSCYEYMDRRMDDEAYENLSELFKMVHLDNMRVLKALINAKDDPLPLLDGSTKTRVRLDVLRRKNVLLLISGPDIFPDELLILEQIHNESRAHSTRVKSHYEMVWIPIVYPQGVVGQTDPKRGQFEKLQESMPWYSVYHPSLIGKGVIRFIQSEWKYKNKPILVVLDPQGRVACPDALHMMWIWGSSAFPFTSSKEHALWREETWRLELLVDGIDAEIFNWIKDEKYIFLYGGDNLDWIRQFVREARRVSQAANIPLEMVYVGKSNKREQVRRILHTIVSEKLKTHSWQEQSMIWFFWKRLESMLLSKLQLEQFNDDSDTILQEIKKILSHDKQGSWVVLAKGSQIVVNGHSTPGLQTLIEYDDFWRENAEREGYTDAFRKHFQKLHEAENPCCRFEFPQAMGRIPEKMRCPECPRHMRMMTTFQCCHDDGADDSSFSVSSVARPAV